MLMRIGAFVLIALSVFAFGLSCYKLYLVHTHPMKFHEEIIIYSKENNLKPELVASVINVESSFKQNSKSQKNAIGLMQIKLSTANYINKLNGESEIDEATLFEPKTNIDLGCKYLRYLIDKFEDLNTSLVAYNAGETRVKDWLNSGIYSTNKKTLNYIPFEETRNYVEKINKNIKYYKKIF